MAENVVWEKLTSDISNLNERLSNVETDVAVISSKIQGIEKLPDTIKSLEITLTKIDGRLERMTEDIQDIKDENKNQNTQINKQCNRGKFDLIDFMEKNAVAIILAIAITVQTIGKMFPKF